MPSYRSCVSTTAGDRRPRGARAPAAVPPGVIGRLGEFEHGSPYILKALFLAEGANENEWYELSMRRSAIQSLIDDYQGTSVAAIINLDDVAQLDEELRRLGQNDEQGPADENAIPRGLLETHWWWRYPDQFK